MKLIDFLVDKRSSVLARWLDAIYAGYPERTAAFLKREKDPFGNPVGSTVSAGAGQVLDALLADAGPDALSDPLRSIVKVRAVQDFTASQAVGFVFQLKGAVTAELAHHEVTADPAQLARLGDRIDRAALLAFDLFMGARETIYRIRSDEARRQTEFLVRRMNRQLGEVDGGEEGSG